MALITHSPTFEGFDLVFTNVDRFSRYVTFIPCKATCIAPDLAIVFFNHTVCKFGMPQKIVSDRNSSFSVQVLVGPHVLLIVYFGNIKWLSPLDRCLIGALPSLC